MTAPATIIELDGRMLVGGRRCAARDGRTLASIDPATAEHLADLAAGRAADVDDAVAAARASLDGGWLKTRPADRAAILFRLASLIREHAGELARIESLDVGKPLREAHADVQAAAAYFAFYAGLADKVFGTTIPLGPGMLDFTVREPVGISVQIVPWNYPLQLSSRGIAPALACGNSVVAKPAEEACLSVLRIADLALEAGLPPGVLNVVTGTGPEAGAALAAHPDIDHLTFTGSVPTGVAVMRAAAGNVVPVTLELGGKSPNVVFADADLDRAAAVATGAIVQNAGQTCSAPSRLLVERRVHDELVEGVASRMRAVGLGRGLDDPGMGPIVSRRQLEDVTGAIERGLSEGATAVTGGGRAQVDGLEGGFFVAPTLLDGVRRGSHVEQEEVFGPVLSVTTFESDDEALAIANGTRYGLVAGVWTNDLRRAHRLAAELKVGQVFVNGYGAGGGIAMPFGGYKQSGFGREKGIEAIQSYTAVKNVCIAFG